MIKKIYSIKQFKSGDPKIYCDNLRDAIEIAKAITFDEECDQSQLVDEHAMVVSDPDRYDPLWGDDDE